MVTTTMFKQRSHQDIPGSFNTYKERNYSCSISDKQSTADQSCYWLVANFVEGTCFCIAEAITYGISTATAIALAVSVAIRDV